MVKLNARCSVILQNELPPKEKDPGSFILPCTIGSNTISNALANLGASISVIPFSLFKRLGLGNPEPINMVIEMVDRSMQSPKGIIENVMVKISKFIFPVDFIILDIVKDDKVPIILGIPMLATAHARIDVFRKKISLEVRTKQIIFDINEKESPTIISPVYVINNFSGINEFEEPRNLEDVLMNDDINGDLGNFLKDNDLLLDFENQDIISLSPQDDFDEMNDMWDDLDPGVLTNEVIDSPVKPEFLSSRNRINLYILYNLQNTCKIGFVNFNPYIEPQSPFNIMSRKVYNSIMKHELVYTGNNMVGFAKNLHVFIGCHQFLIDFIILENVSEFVEKRLTEVLFGQPFKEQVGIIEDRVKGVLWFKIGDDKTMFGMPRAKKRFGKLTIRQRNMMGPILKISNEDKSRRIHQPYQKIKGFYSGCLKLGGEYKHDQEVIDWIKRGHVSIHEMM
ncbi:homeodomain-like protein [Tanacetum coccineum]